MGASTSVAPGIPVTFQLVVNCYPFEYHLFEMDYTLPLVLPRMRLLNIPGMPNVVGPAAEFDNEIVEVLYNGKTNRVLCKLHGIRFTTETIEEVKPTLPEWAYIREIKNVNDPSLNQG